MIRKAQRPAIIVHGGAGEWCKERQEAGLAGVKTAASIGFDILKHDGVALDAVEAAVMHMEDDEVFNAGLGSSLALNQTVEMEACIMDGKTLSAGAAGLLRDVKYPVHLARLVMKETDHVFLVGKSAERIAELFKLEHRNPITDLRLSLWRELKSKVSRSKLGYLPKLAELLKSYPSFVQMDTVGAVAVDSDGNLAAATSTGGLSLKIPGRIGDSPIIGCGNYTDNEKGACSATGLGEIAIRLVLAKSTCDLIGLGQTPQNATENAIGEVNRRIGNPCNQMDLIALDSQGRLGAAHNSSHLCWAYMPPASPLSEASLTAKHIPRNQEYP